MKIGIIGLGIVGSAVQHGLKRVGHEVTGFDIKDPKTSINDVLGTDLCFICVPTPAKEDGSCDTSIVEKVVGELDQNKYQGLVVIKSTVKPGTTDKLAQQYQGMRFAFCPEFLREKATYTDFVENHDLCVIGAYDDHYLDSGQGNLIAGILSKSDLSDKVVTSFGLAEVPKCGQAKEILKYHSLDSESLSMAIRNILSKSDN